MLRAVSAPHPHPLLSSLSTHCRNQKPAVSPNPPFLCSPANHPPNHDNSNLKTPHQSSANVSRSPLEPLLWQLLWPPLPASLLAFLPAFCISLPCSSQRELTLDIETLSPDRSTCLPSPMDKQKRTQSSDPLDQPPVSSLCAQPSNIFPFSL